MYGFSSYDYDYDGSEQKKPKGQSLIVKQNKNASITCNIKFGKSTSANKMSNLKKKIHDNLQLGMHSYHDMKIFNHEGKLLDITLYYIQGWSCMMTTLIT